MNKFLVIIALTLLLTACTPTPTIAPASPTIASNEPITVPDTLAAPQESSPAALTQPPEPEFVPTPPESLGNLQLQILSPQDETVVDTPFVEVIGTASASAVVSINDEIILVASDGLFRATVSLEEGPNLIEILASDASGNETSLLVTVIYEP